MRRFSSWLIHLKHVIHKKIYKFFIKKAELLYQQMILMEQFKKMDIPPKL